MLNGVAPVLIVHLYEELASARDFIAGIPKIGAFLASNVGVPIPIYLDERLTGIYVDHETRNIEIVTAAEQSKAATSTTPPAVYQRGVNNVVSIDMVARQGSIGLMVLLAFSDEIFKRVVAKSYGLTYLNGSTVVFNGLLDSIASRAGRDDDRLQISMQISKAAAFAITAPASAAIVPRVGTLPL